MNTSETSETVFFTDLPVIIFIRPVDEPGADWREYAHGEGDHHLPAGYDVTVRIHNIDDNQLLHLVRDLAKVRQLTGLNLSENRNITNDGLRVLKDLTQLTWLNLSSCGITSEGLDYLRPLTHLETLDISYCNRLTDPGLKALKKLPRLTYLDVHGCVKLTNGGLSRMNRKGLEIHR